MFSWMWNAGGDDSSAESGEAAWIGRGGAASSSGEHPQQGRFGWGEPPSCSWMTDETPGTLKYFQEFKYHLESNLVYPDPELPSLWTESLQGYQTAQKSLTQAKKVLEALKKKKEIPKEEIEQAQKAVNQAKSAFDECSETLRMVGESVLTSGSNDHNGEAKSPSIPHFISEDFDDSSWVTFMVMQNPQHWAKWCCPCVKDTPEPTRVAVAMSFLLDVKAQRRILGEGGGGARGDNYGGYLDILQKLDSSSSIKEPVLERLAQAVALEFADGGLNYFDTKEPVDPVGRYLHYEQAYLMGDLDPAFSTFEIWELRYAVNSPCRDWELQWGRECLQTYRPDWALTDDVQWRYCRLVRLDVGYTKPTWTSQPRTMDQILSGGGKCGPRAWFGRFMCQAFGVPIWGVRQPGHAAMSRWTEKGWMICLGASFEHSWWEDRCGLDFKLETMVRDRLPSPTDYLQQVLRLEWLARYNKESNKSIRKSCVYDPAAPWYALSLAQRHILAKIKKFKKENGGERYYPRSTRTVPKILHVQATSPKDSGLPVLCNSGICIPADATSTTPSNKVLVMPSFTGGRQVFLGTDAILDFALEEHWLPTVEKKYRLTAKVATAHAKDTGLLVTVIPKGRWVVRKGEKNAQKRQEVGDCYRLPLPYTKGLWGETEGIEISLRPEHALIAFQREWQKQYGMSLKEIRLEPC